MDQKDSPRELLGIAMTMEDESLRFYLELAEQSSNARVKEFCIAMAHDEARHFEMYHEMQLALAATYRSVLIDNKDFKAQLAKARAMGQDEGNVTERIKALGEHGALIVAIEREKQAVGFYEQLLRSFPQHAETIHQIIREEDGHVERLEDLAAAVSGLA